MSKVFTITEGLQNLGALKTGGQGSVYRGMRMGPIYSAIKLIPTPIYVEDESDKNYRNFLNEVTKLQKVNEKPSPNVVKILSSGITESGSFPYIEMEYIDGPELSDLLLPPNQKVFSIKELLKVTEQLASALAHCHNVGVKHGDLKSNNVKYNVHTANYVLLDFGLAIMSEEQRRTSIRHAGAIEFMAPEQHEGKMLLQSDVYSYGIILYEILAGQVPFPLAGNGETGRNSVMLGHLEKEVPDAMALRRKNLLNTVAEDVLTSEMQVPHWLLQVIERCVQKNPNDRFADGMALYKAVTNGMLTTPEGTGKNKIFEKELALLKQQGKQIRLLRAVVIGSSVASMLLLGVLIFKKPTIIIERVPTATATPPTNYEPPFITYGKQYQKQLLKAREDSIQNANRAAEKLRAADEAKKVNDKKKKRKKFLGIF